MTTTVVALTGVRVNLSKPDAVVYMIYFPNGDFYTDVDSTNAWPLHVAKAIARNVSIKRRTTTRLVAHKVEEVVHAESSFDRILNYVDSLKGRALTDALLSHGLTKGSDPVASKRERLIAHYTKCSC